MLIVSAFSIVLLVKILVEKAYKFLPIIINAFVFSIVATINDTPFAYQNVKILMVLETLSFLALVVSVLITSSKKE